jgi:hypothetical protein
LVEEWTVSDALDFCVDLTDKADSAVGTVGCNVFGDCVQVALYLF